MAISDVRVASVAEGTQRLIENNRLRREAVLKNPELVFWWRRPCTVKVLLVTDGALDFGQGDFGLSTFVDVMLHDAPSRVRFQLTLGHLRSDVTDAQVMAGAPGIARSIKGLRFDEPTHFMPDMYDEVWLFGFETFYQQGSYAQRLANPQRYPADRLGDAELKALSAHMNRGGGMFATGDHGRLGRGLCGSVNRVRSMRHWDSFPSNAPAVDEVGMTGPRRNDSNRPGHDAGSQFSDQSDDIPQDLDLLLYSAPAGLLRRARWPHPVLCGTAGRINVFPDHPHEGEARVPADVTLKYALDGSDEYPLIGAGPARAVPEVVAHGRVLAGSNASGGKQATAAHRFGVLSTYDGHRAKVGRVVCDSTWHHFVNVNLIGVVEGGGFDEFDTHPGEDASKHNGFLSSASGIAALAKIRNYYTNVGIWIAPPARQACFARQVWWQLVYADRVMEAALADPATPLAKIPADVLYAIGVHARDAFGQRASQCQSLEWALGLADLVMPELRRWIDPWDPITVADAKEAVQLPLVDPMPLLDTALGAALGETLNIMTLGGLALVIGTLLDNNIVVQENLHRHLETLMGDAETVRHRTNLRNCLLSTDAAEPNRIARLPLRAQQNRLTRIPIRANKTNGNVVAGRASHLRHHDTRRLAL